jgi:hypothetical protein
MIDGKDKPAPQGPSKLRWVLGWIVLPGTLIAGLFLAGVHVGARRPDQGLARLLLKVFGGEPGVAVERPEPRPPEPRPGAKPGEPFSISEQLLHKQLQAIADKKNLGLEVADLECEHVCRAVTKAEFGADVYALERCEYSRALSWAPSMLECSGKLEAGASDQVGESDKPAP